ncbi:PGN_0703 family putative restriction endonuclease [Microvirga zambiensis]|uniref:PGN_0703 family putative restriction endonuclease n=1 Tax=Microvirga zambiensis TaxID=1402137 RepID=UPI00191EF441|nr:hypothetical protein [Microvirga zambiensis]
MKSAFIASQRKAQAAFFERTVPPDSIRPSEGWRLLKGLRGLNLAPTIRESMEVYFGPPRSITWHQHADHGLSSQICCLNFLGPLATNPDLLSQVIGHALGIAEPRMLPVEEGPGGERWFVGFEWTGLANHLGEWAKGAKSATRGANATSADAVVRFEREGRIETLLIEWKYTEEYGAAIDEKGNATRVMRYSDKAFAPNGPVRADLGLTLEDFFWEPFYQLLRQQMLAWQMTKAKESSADRVRVLHISPAGNSVLRKVTAPNLRRFGDDAFNVFRSVLVQPDDFLSRTTHEAFGPFIDANHGDPAAREWARYLLDRYGSILDTA